MFGYIRPLECELKVREQSRYRAWYCGLCKTIGTRYGFLPRMTLNYDCTFLALTLGCLKPEAESAADICLLRPQKGKHPTVTENDALRFAADANVLLAWYQQDDAWRDEKNVAALAVRSALYPAAQRAKKNAPALAETICRGIAALSAVEKTNASCTDEPADAFAETLRGVIRCAPGIAPSEADALGWMYYNLGRWIYLADAWEDQEKDKKRGSYNPFVILPKSNADASFLLHVSLTEAEKAYNLLNVVSDRGLMDNIMYLGCRKKTRLLLNEEKLNESV